MGRYFVILPPWVACTYRSLRGRFCAFLGRIRSLCFQRVIPENTPLLTLPSQNLQALLSEVRLYMPQKGEHGVPAPISPGPPQLRLHPLPEKLVGEPSRMPPAIS